MPKEITNFVDRRCCAILKLVSRRYRSAYVPGTRERGTRKQEWGGQAGGEGGRGGRREGGREGGTADYHGCAADRS